MNSLTAPTALTLFSLFTVAETEGHIVEPDKEIVLGENPIGLLCPIMRKIWGANELLSRGAHTEEHLAKEWRILETLLWELLNADFGENPNIPSDHRVLAVRQGFQLVSRKDNARGDWHWFNPARGEKPVVRVEKIGDFPNFPGLFDQAA